jgi:hypothetical protein
MNIASFLEWWTFAIPVQSPVLRTIGEDSWYSVCPLIEISKLQGKDGYDAGPFLAEPSSRCSPDHTAVTGVG